MLTDLIALCEAIADRAADFLIAFAALGGVTMAVIQTLKELTPIRARFNERALTSWLRQSIRQSRQLTRATGQEGAAVDGATEARVVKLADACKDELITLATAGMGSALFSLDTERMAGQINAAAGIVVDFPTNHLTLLRCLAVHASKDDIKDVLQMHALSRATGQSPSAVEARVEARVRLMHQVQRNIDAFQIATAFAWKQRLQMAALLISMTLGLATVLWSVAGGRLVGVGRGLAFGLAAGFLAPIAHDLLGILNRGRQR
jgi:hypothetical protein